MGPRLSASLRPWMTKAAVAIAGRSIAESACGSVAHFDRVGR
jgi:hypothetical protein